MRSLHVAARVTLPRVEGVMSENSSIVKTGLNFIAPSTRAIRGFPGLPESVPCTTINKVSPSS